MKAAVLGANGFVGGRMVEKFHLEKTVEVRPVVRTYSGLARLARFDNLDWRLADARDCAALAKAIEGCDVVVNSIQGEPRVILETAVQSYKAAQAAGVRRLVFISSAAVNGLAPAPGTDEAAPIRTDSPFPYSNAKARAEGELSRLRRGGSVELVILRPSIIYGPRSPRWTAGVAGELLDGTACLLDGGRGICNTVYVDNLIEAVELSFAGAKSDGQVFFVSDREEVTWADLYRPIAEALGVDMTAIPGPTGVTPQPRPALKHALKQFHNSTRLQSILPFFPLRLKRVLRAAMATPVKWQVPNPWLQPEAGRPVLTEEMAGLERCKYKLPIRKAEDLLGYRPSVSFEEGCRRAVAWLRFAGYRAL